ncbi:hypothetical protein [Acinetobacter sp. MD2(2019)]|uniref:hypothetical protein n=1 Tax=Acinetobacter sp. MD2(2019) TaxID=2605273 RepID=UPI002D1F6585|nr:hypothetical protein [Acinetobacter sp. MD2(2019)]MEB3755099.1 hypothetical protein [Acinetobacter sp. MD2(2019)]
MKKSIQVIEHTPIYDLHAYNARQSRFKRQKLLKNFIEASSFICLMGITFSTLFFVGY